VRLKILIIENIPNQWIKQFENHTSKWILLQTNEKLQAWCRKIGSGYIFRLCFEEILSKFVISAKQKEKYNRNSFFLNYHALLLSVWKIGWFLSSD
jgi:hypothetical protein